jgi:hypothetical protein
MKIKLKYNATGAMKIIMHILKRSTKRHKALTFKQIMREGLRLFGPYLYSEDYMRKGMADLRRIKFRLVNHKPKDLRIQYSYRYIY